MRVILNKKSIDLLFSELKRKHKTKTFRDLASKLNVPYKTMEKWKAQERTMPKEFIPKELESKLTILERKKDHWGKIVGGKKGGKRSVELQKKKWGEDYSKVMSERGKKLINTIQKRIPQNELQKLAREGKRKKRERESKRKDEEYQFFFTNEEVFLDTRNIKLSNSDLKRKLVLPSIVNEDLAEEIGIHLGDGCLSRGKNYFSVKCNKTERDYVKEFMFPLYKRLYNIDLKHMFLPSVTGFEIYSKAVFDFKHKTLKIPYGEKKDKITVPECILETRNRKVYAALIRGAFDTDGCVDFIRPSYPRISIFISSEELIKRLGEMLEKLGFLPRTYKYTVVLHGQVMVKKWNQIIGSHNPKNIKRLAEADS